jgi:hypothetical protein
MHTHLLTVIKEKIIGVFQVTLSFFMLAGCTELIANPIRKTSATPSRNCSLFLDHVTSASTLKYRDNYSKIYNIFCMSYLLLQKNSSASSLASLIVVS